MANETITLRTTFTSGSGGQAKLYHFAGGQLDAEGQPLASPPAVVASSNQAAYVQAFTQATDPSLAPGDVDVRSVGKAPAGLTQALITVSDGRFVNGQPVRYQISVTIEANPDMSAIAPVGSEPVRSL